MDIKWIQQKTQSEEYDLSLHAIDECEVEEILISDLEQAISEGEILEQYQDRGDIRGESCLVLGYDGGRRAIHVVIARIHPDAMRIITAYLPKPPKFIDERTRRK